MKERFFHDDKRKECFLKVLIEKVIRFEWKLLYWVMLDNHYHILIKSKKDASALVKLISQLHSATALYCNKLESKKSRKIWWNYWDSCITYEKSFFTRINYIHYNPVKHGYVDEPEDCLFSSYNTFMREYSHKGKIIHNRYPFDKIDIKDDF